MTTISATRPRAAVRPSLRAQFTAYLHRLVDRYELDAEAHRFTGEVTLHTVCTAFVIACAVLIAISLTLFAVFG